MNLIIIALLFGYFSSSVALTSVQLIPFSWYISCGWYGLQYQSWSTAITQQYLVSSSECLSKLTQSSTVPCPPPMALSSYACTATTCNSKAASSDQSLCLIIYNTNSINVTCDVIISGSQEPAATATTNSLAWPVWQIVAVSLGGFAALTLVVLILSWWFWYKGCLASIRVAPEPPPGGVDFAKVPLPGRYPAMFVPSEKPELRPAILPHHAVSNPPSTPPQFHEECYYIEYPPPLQPATYAPGFNNEPQSVGKAKQLEPIMFYSQAYPAFMTQTQAGRIPR
ncbi:hypothetical protein CEUSTIGMA_g4324.t1 [Chlamydomonas eustigma]|uniref:Uncharacterized protein n=1 Tax=Chlamydomonas eustigma TaxID=1157962 RepID=A0A250X1C6_9CHLO|nr:hypothetical protein CEUSTIGMA_g4324.t1 [Chlamydomonas eustigma]|eukprot:GAX76878.1 hypothetical protein CEUSTIGMA_g4324.t1 [Chlamydomonas eustigma]